MPEQTKNPDLPFTMLDAVNLIAKERWRQMAVEGWSPEHDDEHNCDEMAMAAACYALPLDTANHHSLRMELWPWSDGWWKPTPDDRIRQLVKAGALIVAEIERLQREAENDADVSELLSEG